MLFILTIYADVIGVLRATNCVFKLGMSSNVSSNAVQSAVSQGRRNWPREAFFGGSFRSWVANFGFTARDGAEGVGRATTLRSSFSDQWSLLPCAVYCDFLFLLAERRFFMIQIQGLHKWFWKSACFERGDLTIKEGETIVITWTFRMREKLPSQAHHGDSGTRSRRYLIDGRSMFTMEGRTRTSAGFNLGCFSRARLFLIADGAGERGFSLFEHTKFP